MSDNYDTPDLNFQDAVTEILNIGLSDAANLLSRMVNQEVKLRVLGVKTVTPRDALNILQEKNTKDGSGVSQRFNGMMGGEVLLLFLEASSLKLVRALFQQDIALDDLTEMEQEAMTEIGNIILNGCLCSVADVFKQQITSSIPEFFKGSLDNILIQENLIENDQASLLLLDMDFYLDKNKIEGYFCFIVNAESVLLFKRSVEAYLGG